jgi:hypothetical protein
VLLLILVSSIRPAEPKSATKPLEKYLVALSI